MAQNNISIPIFKFLENVVSSTEDVTDKYTQLAGGPPVTIRADMWGWVQRRRLFWLACDTHQRKERTLATVDWKTIPLPDGFSLVNSNSAAVAAEVKASTTKQWPSTVLFEDGFAAVIAPGDAGRKFHPFTREFRHPTDRVKQVFPRGGRQVL